MRAYSDGNISNVDVSESAWVPGDFAKDLHPRPLPKSPLMKQAKKAVFAHILAWYRRPEISGSWGSWAGFIHDDPTRRYPDGRPELGTVYTPRIGCYDQTDPHLVEYHCQLLKMAGIDGFVLNMDEFPSDATCWRARFLDAYMKYMRKYELKATLSYEDSARFKSPDHKDRPSAVAAARKDMEDYLAFLDPIIYKVGQRPVFGTFSYQFEIEDKGTSRLSPDELRAWIEGFPESHRPIVMSQWYHAAYRGVLAAHFAWVSSMPRENVPNGSPLAGYADLDFAIRDRRRTMEETERKLTSGEYTFFMDAVWPGFDSRGVWGWAGGPARIERANGLTYQFEWEQAIMNDAPLVQIVTWNDWPEGTIVEPSVEFGFKYLEMTRRYIAIYKKRTEPDGDLRTPEWIYKLRKTAKSEETNRTLEKACELIRTGCFEEATELMAPLAGEHGLDDEKYWGFPLPSVNLENDLLGMNDEGE